jgi:hypothetical protein
MTSNYQEISHINYTENVKHNRSLKVGVQGLVLMAHPVYIHKELLVNIFLSRPTSYILGIISVIRRTWCLGEYLDLKWKKCWDGGESCIMRNFIVYTPH